jgi:hypothetical protein
MTDGIETRIGRMAIVPLMLASLAVSHKTSAEEIPINERYTPQEAVWAWYGQMHTDMGIMSVVCKENSKHYDPEMCDASGKDLLWHTEGYIDSMRTLDKIRSQKLKEIKNNHQPHKRYKGNR